MSSDKVTAGELHGYWRGGIKKARAGISWGTLCRSVGGSIFVFVAQYEFGVRGKRDSLVMVFIALAGALLVFVVEFLVRLLVFAPVELARDAKREIEGLKQDKMAQELTAEHNKLLAEQVELSKQHQTREMDRERRDAIPFFRWRGGSTVGGLKVCDFENQGGPITDLSARASVAMGINIFPKQIIQKNEMGKVEFIFPGSFPGPFEFWISFTTRLGEQGTKKFRISSHIGGPEEVR